MEAQTTNVKSIEYKSTSEIAYSNDPFVISNTQSRKKESFIEKIISKSDYSIKKEELMLEFMFKVNIKQILSDNYIIATESQTTPFSSIYQNITRKFRSNRFSFMDSGNSITIPYTYKNLKSEVGIWQEYLNPELKLLKPYLDNASFKYLNEIEPDLITPLTDYIKIISSYIEKKGFSNKLEVILQKDSEDKDFNVLIIVISASIDDIDEEIEMIVEIGELLDQKINDIISEKGDDFFEKLSDITYIIEEYS